MSFTEDKVPSFEEKKIHSKNKYNASALDVMNFFAANDIKLALDTNPYKKKPNAATNTKATTSENIGCAIIKHVEQKPQNSKNISQLSVLIEEIRAFEGCELKKNSINTVISDGNPNSNIMLIGEAPGATEDELGIPFCGESGKLLDNIISSIGLTRATNVYISNTVFWRPPDNRKPTDAEIAACKPFVERHIALIQPKLIILVGSTAGSSLLGKDFQISKMRRNFFEYTNQYLSEPIKATAIFHPAYLLRQSSQKKSTWYDVLIIKNFIQEHKLL